MSFLNKSTVAWQLAIATALGAYGGFPSAPLWWRKITQYKITQLTLWLLVYQGGGKGELLWTTLVSAIVYFDEFI